MSNALIGLCGTGRMGSAMAERLMEAGYSIMVWNRDGAKAAPLVEKGAKLAASPKELAAACDTVITILFDRAAVEAVYQGSDGLLAGAGSRSLFVEMSTLGSDGIGWLQEAIASSGAALLECPVGGSVGPARKGQLLALVGGDAKALDRARPVLETLCRRIEHAGPLGAGARLKLAVNLPLMVYWTALGEALALVSDLEIAPNRLIDLMADTSGTAAVLPRKQEAVTRLVEGADFPPAEFEMRGATKDLAFMVEAARARGIDLPVSSAARSVFEAAAADGMAGEDAIVIAALAYLKSRKS